MESDASGETVYVYLYDGGDDGGDDDIVHDVDASFW